MSTWALQGRCPDCTEIVLFECSREEETTAHGHRVLKGLTIICPSGHRFHDTEAEHVLHGDRHPQPAEGA